LTGALGVSKVFLYRPKERKQPELPSVVIQLSQSKETRASASAPIGKKYVHYTCTLEIFEIDMTPDGSGALAFDDMLDAIDDKLRTDPTLGGVVLAATIEHITTTVAPPQLLDGQAVALLALKSFDITVLTTG
jgi:hypothetical protein